jgi:hypothetical protein
MEKRTLHNSLHGADVHSDNRAWQAASRSLRQAGEQLEAFVARLRASLAVSDFPIEMSQAEVEADLACGRD